MRGRSFTRRHSDHRHTRHSALRTSSHALIALVCVVSLAAAGCSFQTEYTLSIDVLSFLSEEERSEELSYSNEAIDIYLFPELDYFDQGAAPPPEFQLGYPVEFPDYDEDELEELPDNVDLRLEFHFSTLIENGAGAEIPGGDAEVMIGSFGTENVFTDGTQVASTSIPAVPQNDSHTVKLPGSVALADHDEIVESGGIHIGVRIRLEGTGPGGSTVEATATLTTAQIDISGFPFKALP